MIFQASQTLSIAAYKLSIQQPIRASHSPALAAENKPLWATLLISFLRILAQPITLVFPFLFVNITSLNSSFVLINSSPDFCLIFTRFSFNYFTILVFFGTGLKGGRSCGLFVHNSSLKCLMNFQVFIPVFPIISSVFGSILFHFNTF